MKTAGILTERLQEHPAVKAWRQVHSGPCQPHDVEPLKERRDKSAVYRLHGILPDGSAVIAKGCPRATALVERTIYQELLPLGPLPALRCYGFLDEAEDEDCWLFLEDAPGERYSPQIPEHRALAGRWLAETQLATLAAGREARLPARDLGHYLRLLQSSRSTLLEHLARNTALSGDDAEVLYEVVAVCDTLETLWRQMERGCEAMPETLVHDDFAEKNLRVRQGASGAALMVFDWEFAGWGLPAADLAELGHYVASPDLAAYWSILKRESPHLSLRDVQRAADCGHVLRLINEIDWANGGLQFDSPRHLSKLVSTLRLYAPQLAAASSELRWS